MRHLPVRQIGFEHESVVCTSFTTLILVSDIFRVFCADHTYTTLALPYNATAQTIVNTAEERVLLGDDCVLCEVKSSGGLFQKRR